MGGNPGGVGRDEERKKEKKEGGEVFVNPLKDQSCVMLILRIFNEE